jgi:WD40 repeat protein
MLVSCMWSIYSGNVLTLIQAGVPCKWAHDSQRFLLEFFDIIQDSPSQIYHSALPISPPSSWLHNSYTADLQGEVKVVKGPPAGWGTCFRAVTLDSNAQALAHWKDAIAAGLDSGDIVTLDGITGSQVAILSGHTGSVACLSFSSDGTSPVSGSHDKTLKLWDVQTGGVIKTFHGHTGQVISVSISFNYTKIASGSYDESIRLWDIQTRECYHTKNHQEYMGYVSFSSTNPQHLISISDGDIQQWDTDGQKIEPTYKGHYVAFSLDGTHLVSNEGGITMVQNSGSGAIVAKFPTIHTYRWCCSPNGGLVAVVAQTVVYVWDITGSNPHLSETFIGHTQHISSLTFSSSSSLISASEDNSVRFWQIGASSTDLVASGPDSTLPSLSPVESVSLQAESGIAITSSSDGVVRAWDISTGLCEASFKSPATGGSLRDVQMIDDRFIVVLVKGRNIYIRDAKEGELLQMANAGLVGGWALKISEDGSKVFFLEGDCLQAWSMWTGEAMGMVMLEGEPNADLCCVGGSRVCVSFPNLLIQGWDFGISGSPQLHCLTHLWRVLAWILLVVLASGIEAHLMSRKQLLGKWSLSCLGDMQHLMQYSGVVSIWLLAMSLERC